MTLLCRSMELVSSSWGERVAEAIEANGTSQRKLATEVGLSQSAINKIVRGEFRPTDENRLKIAAALGKEVQDLFPYPKGKVR